MSRFFYNGKKYGVNELKAGVYDGIIKDIVVDDTSFKCLSVKPKLALRVDNTLQPYNQGILFEGELLDNFLSGLEEDEHGMIHLENAINKECCAELETRINNKGAEYLALVRLEVKQYD